MSVGSLSAPLSQPPPSSSGNFKQVKEDLNAIAKALNSGDLAGAQQAFASLRKNTPTPSEIGSDNSRRTRAEQGTGEFKQLADALRSNDVGGAKKAVAEAQRHVQAPRPPVESAPAAPRPAAPTETTGRAINALA